MQRIMKADNKNKDGRLLLEENPPLRVQALYHGEEHFKAGDDGILDVAEFTAHAEHKLKALEDGPERSAPVLRRASAPCIPNRGRRAWRTIF